MVLVVVLSGQGMFAVGEQREFAAHLPALALDSVRVFRVVESAVRPSFAENASEGKPGCRIKASGGQRWCDL